PMIGPYRPSEYIAPDGALLRRLLPQREPNPLAWPANVMFIQPELDALLRARLADWPGVALRTGAAVTGLAQDAGGVRLDLADGSTAAARYALCCDGAGSPLRRALGAGHEDLDFDEPWVVVDTLLEDPSVRLPETNVQYCHPARPTTFIHGPRNLRRWEFMLLPGEDPQAMATEESVWRLLAPWMKPGQARLWRIAAYRFHALVARPWRFGRAFLLGDAAHQTPPFMGQGLNQGLRDSLNLCWKLALALRGEAGDALLDSYEAERRPNVREVIAITRDLGRIVCERDPARAAARDAALKAEAAAGRADVIRQDLLPPIADGFILRGTPGAGQPCPQPWVVTPGGRARLDDVLGDAGFRLFLRGDIMAPPAALPRLTVLRLGTPPLIEADGLLAAWMARQGAVALLERPDHVVYGTARDAAGSAALLAAAGAALA
ncbi:MAG: bifunctional 3-(3-hydroxy-phenyl)propionate/3-hydroxycinnamic acid hydroxylase, partial [Acetobacteraceae bacterium]|nr:bifunctional 3-(3-hydroxy-phenyl)propionate/3-hydroxycinnamic acid hydroxylase [Acetobacteraceae bacterium]